MANGQNTALYGGLVVQLATQLLGMAQTWKTAQDTGVDITDDQLAAAKAGADSAGDDLQNTIDKMPG